MSDGSRSPTVRLLALSERSRGNKSKQRRGRRALPFGTGGQLGSGLAGDLGLLLLGLGLVPLLRARLLGWRRLPLLSVRAPAAGVGTVVRPRLHLAGHADAAHTGTGSSKRPLTFVF